jgi:hypothetical protein
MKRRQDDAVCNLRANGRERRNKSSDAQQNSSNGFILHKVCNAAKAQKATLDV